jgi:uncharacterized protein CbrC (UPF0167 family)
VSVRSPPQRAGLEERRT